MTVVMDQQLLIRVAHAVEVHQGQQDPPAEGDDTAPVRTAGTSADGV
jgi:hypothetical protein